LIEEEMKTFHNKQKLKEYTATKQALQKILKVLLLTEKKIRARQEDVRKNKPF
jgi:hypothetical protein